MADSPYLLPTDVVARPVKAETYCCPGQQHPISRAVHLGRLSAFYPGCRQCPHRDDTGTLSAKQVEQLSAVAQRVRPPSLFHEEGAGACI
jgi:phosphomannomutase